MAKVRNKTDEVHQDFHTGRVAGPGDVIPIPDEWVASYEDHPVWALVPDPTAKSKSQLAAASSSDETEEDSK